MEVRDDVARGVPNDAGPGALGHLLHVHGEEVLGGHERVDENDRRDVLPEEPAHKQVVSSSLVNPICDRIIREK